MIEDCQWSPPHPEDRVLFISLGTVFNDRPEFFRTCIEAFADAPVNPTTDEREITAAMEHLRSGGVGLGTIRFEGSYFNVNSADDRDLAERHLRRARRSRAAGEDTSIV